MDSRLLEDAEHGMFRSGQAHRVNYMLVGAFDVMRDGSPLPFEYPARRWVAARFQH